MKSFQFYDAKDIKEATKLSGSDSRYLSGGMTLVPSLKQRLATPRRVIGLKKIKKLNGIKVSKKSVTIGATTTHREVEFSKEIEKIIPALNVLAGGIGDAQVRNCGTIGGSIANNDPAACYPSAVLGLNATIHTSKGKIEGEKFFTGMFETKLKTGEMITSIEFKVPDKAGYAKFPNPASRYAIVGVFVAKFTNEVRVAITGAESCVFRCKKLEDALSSNFSASSIDGVNISSEGFNADVHATAEYRANLIKVMAKKAVLSC